MSRVECEREGSDGAERRERERERERERDTTTDRRSHPPHSYCHGSPKYRGGTRRLAHGTAAASRRLAHGAACCSCLLREVESDHAALPVLVTLGYTLSSTTSGTNYIEIHTYMRQSIGNGDRFATSGNIRKSGNTNDKIHKNRLIYRHRLY